MRSVAQLQREGLGAPPATLPPIFCGRPALLSNPFEGRPGIGRARAQILYRHWLNGDLTPRILRCGRGGFGHDEAIALNRWRDRVLAALPQIGARQLLCPCWPKTLCHIPIIREFGRIAT